MNYNTDLAQTDKKITQRKQSLFVSSTVSAAHYDVTLSSLHLAALNAQYRLVIKPMSVGSYRFHKPDWSDNG